MKNQVVKNNKNLVTSGAGWLRVVTGGYRRLQGGNAHFSWQTHRQTLHHNIYIYYHNFIIQVLSELHTITKLQIGISSSLLSIYFKRYVHEELGQAEGVTGISELVEPEHHCGVIWAKLGGWVGCYQRKPCSLGHQPVSQHSHGAVIATSSLDNRLIWAILGSV